MHRIQLMAACAVLAAGSNIMFAAQGDAAKGKQVFEMCTVCHSAGSDVKMEGAPALKGLFKKEKLKNGKKPTEANIREKVEEGGGGMPPYKDSISGTDKDNLIAYLKTL